MTEIVSIRFKSCGKNYSFSPEGMTINSGDKVIVETAKGIELAECTRGNRMVEDTSVVQPLRPVIRVATEQDLKTAEQNKLREKEAFTICQKKIEAHGLDMKLVDVELSFDGSKTLFFFTSDGRVDFRDLVKDLAGIFHNRIELRQIGVRDEAKMIGGIGICGRPYCCNEFLSDFAPVSTKMAKVQNLSLNPAKISGSCGRLMCCLRYEEEAYEDLVKTVPKVGAFVESVGGYGVATAVDLLRQTVTVHVDGEAEDTFHVFKAAEVAAVPGGRPKDGEPYPKVLNYVPEEEKPEESAEDPWATPDLFAGMQSSDTVSVSAVPDAEPAGAADDSPRARGRGRDRRRSGSRHGKKPENRTENKSSADDAKADAVKEVKGVEKSADKKASSGEDASQLKKNGNKNRTRRGHGKKRPNGESASAAENTRPSQTKANAQAKDTPKPPKPVKGSSPAGESRKPVASSASVSGSDAVKSKNNRRRYYHSKGKKNSGGAQKTE